MQRYLKKALIASIILLFTVSASGQYYKKRKYLEGLKIQPKAGINMFYGDLVSQKRTNYTFGVALEKELTSFTNARFDLNYGSMKGTQLLPSTDLAYAYFKNSYIHFNAGVTFRPLDLALGLFKQRRFNPYVVGQLGLMQFSTTEYWGEAGSGPADTPWREVSEMSPTFSMGGGLNMYLTSHISLTGEFIGTYLFSDRVDGHDVWYLNYGQADQTEVQTDGNDFFYVATVGVTYLFSDSQWKNSPKYNRKAYLRTRSLYNSDLKKKYSRPSKRTTKRYKR